MTPAKKLLYLSPSRINTFNDCSVLYAAKYLVQLPDPGNDGSHRGSTVHDTLELLAKPRHRHRFDDAIAAGSCREVPAVWRLVRRFARKYSVDCEPHLSMIDDFLMVALRDEFFGPPGTIQDLSERDAKVSVDKDGKRYNLRCIMDRTYIVAAEDETVSARLLDWKSSKEKYKGKDLNDNIQSKSYQLMLRHLHPDIPDRRFNFSFLKFADDPRQPQPSLTDAELDEFEARLTKWQRAIETFTLADILDHPASSRGDLRWKCGKEGLKPDGVTPHWICPARLPQAFWVVTDKAGNVLRTAPKEAEVTLAAGEQLKIREWSGCPVYFDSSGRRIR